jgi:glutathione S-transferase
MNTPNGQAVQVLLEELKDAYGTEWTTTLIDIFTNDQKKEWFLRLDPNGRMNCCVSRLARSLTSHRPHPSPSRQHSEPSIRSHGDLGRIAV